MYFDLLLTNHTEHLTILACPSLICFLHRGSIEHLCLVLVYVLFYICVWIEFVDLP